MDDLSLMNTTATNVALRIPVGFVLLVLAALATGGCAGNSTVSEDELAEARDIPSVFAEQGTASADTDQEKLASTDECESAEEPNQQTAQRDCVEKKTSDEALLDRTQRTVYEVMENTTRWFDGFFGESGLREEDYVSRGSLRVSALWDERDGFDSRFNLRARFALPALEERARLIVGRGDTEDIVDGTANEAVDSLPGSFDTNRDDDWLIGLGFNRSGDTSRGFDFGIGVRITNPPDPYVNVTYRWTDTWDNAWAFHSRTRAFWQNQRGTGITQDANLDYAVSPTLMLRWANNFGVEDRVDGLAWRSDVIAYQGLPNNRGLAYGVFAQGETAAEVELQNVGIDLRYRQRLTREWFFIELATGISWPKFLLIEQRESNLGVGITFEMRFGRW